MATKNINAGVNVQSYSKEQVRNLEKEIQTSLRQLRNEPNYGHAATYNEEQLTIFVIPDKDAISSSRSLVAVEVLPPGAKFRLLKKNHDSLQNKQKQSNSHNTTQLSHGLQLNFIIIYLVGWQN